MTKLKFLQRSLWIVILLVQIHELKACLESERMGLLELKAAFTKQNGKGDSFNSWVDDRTSNCCGWHRVRCEATTGRVKKLSLNDITNNDYDQNPSVNVSLFHPFEELRSLNLSANGFGNWIPSEGYKSVASLKKLETLDLRYNGFNQSIFSSLRELKSLKTLILKDNGIGGSFSMEEILHLRSLKLLDLHGNYLHETLSVQDYQGLSNLKKLEVLDLGSNNFNISILSIVSILPSLKILILSGNGMGGFSPIQEITSLKTLEMLDLSSNQFNGSIKGVCELKNLTELDLSENQFGEHLPLCLSNLTHLRVLDLSSNKLSGNIPSVFSNLSSLEYLSLSSNNFEGSFSLASLANNSKLQVFLLSQSNKLQFETDNFSWLPAFQLKALSLSNSNLKTIPSFLLYQHDLRVIDLSYNYLVEEFPTWFLQNNSKLGALDLSKNNLSGRLPNDNGVFLKTPKLAYLNLSNNGLEGAVPPSMGELKQLEILDLSGNKFRGELPRGILSNCTELQVLDLSNNRFDGEIFPHYMNLSSLANLFLNDNFLSGSIGSPLSNSQILSVLDISNNKVSGGIPQWIGSFSPSIVVISMSRNLLEGSIPVQLCNPPVLTSLDLSENRLSGPMPSCFDLSTLQFLHLQGNSLSGLLPSTSSLSERSSTITIDLRNNKFFGSIPGWISELSSLRILLLGGNCLEGQIPEHLCQLQSVSMMDLSHNKLSGSIPSCFINISFGTESVIYDYYTFTESWSRLSGSFHYNSTLELPYTEFTFGDGQEEVEFTTKSRYNSYKGDILNYMSGLDLSSNNLSGEIPPAVGELQAIHALNFSHNQLSGSIPKSFSGLKQIESLDLSSNNLSGEIPPQLTELNFLSSFNVSQNNLNGVVPDNSQFSTFDESSYAGNPDLCVPYINKSCTTIGIEQPPPTVDTVIKAEEDESAVDMEAFGWTFGGSFATVFLGFAAVLFINPYWRRVWFYFIDWFILVCSEWIRGFGLFY